MEKLLEQIEKIKQLHQLAIFTLKDLASVQLKMKAEPDEVLHIFRDEELRAQYFDIQQALIFNENL